ncbi:hypothetical protein [Idiomarina sp.]|uniref:hypothetical protein n=1 Tax=Idiomarina sp. TaxID=1874361 RepID=UPI002586A093|nr:hypothetical protein [Idiomarina sp.]
MSATLIATGIGLVTDWLAGKREKAQAQTKAEIKQLDNASAWEIAALKGAGKFLRLVSYSMFGLPMVITVISPEHGQKIWDNLQTVPEWYLTTFISINGAVWGIAELKRPISAIMARRSK